MPQLGFSGERSWKLEEMEGATAEIEHGKPRNTRATGWKGRERGEKTKKRGRRKMENSEERKSRLNARRPQNRNRRTRLSYDFCVIGLHADVFYGLIDRKKCWRCFETVPGVDVEKGKPDYAKTTGTQGWWSHP